MGLKSFLHSDFRTKVCKIKKWWHKNDWVILHKASLSQRIKNECLLLIHPDRYIVVLGWLLKFHDSKEKYMNWGDDINVYLFERITGKTVIPSETLLFGKYHSKYSFIGSVISTVDSRTIVWGSGVLNLDSSLMTFPKQILAVRGPKTRDYLLNNGISCPDIYGDPALLLPLTYQPTNKCKKYKVTFIPHHHDYDNIDQLQKILINYPDCHVINMTHYKNWTDVIDEICQSEKVVSSSLHGLIVSDAYGIPNVFCEFIYKHQKIDKYLDYYASIGYSFSNHYSSNDINYLIKKDIPIKSLNIDIKSLIQVCPIQINLN